MSWRWTRFALLAGLATWSTTPARSQDYPSRPVTMIDPFPPGSPTTRLFADGMRVSLGQPVIVENVSGAGGTIGVARAARAAPDGYTICIGQPVSHVFSGAVYNVRYDLLNDFEPIALLVSSPLWLVGKAALPADGVDGLVAWLKANPDKASFGTVGQASPSHVWGIQFQSMTGTHFQFVPYRGGPPVAQALVAGEVDISSLSAPLTLPLVRSGQLKAYAVLGETRWRGAPEIWTIAEAGVPDCRCPCGSGCGRRKERPGTSLPGSTLPSSRRSAIPRSLRASPTWATRFSRASSRRQRLFTPCRRPRSRSGGP